MNKLKINYIINLGLLVSFIIILITGILRFPEIYRILGMNYGQVARTLPVYEFRVLHDWFGLLFGVLAFLHLLLHWRWWISVTKSMFRRDKK